MAAGTLSPERLRPYQSVHLELSPEDVEEVMSFFLRFLELPYDQRVQLTYYDPDKPRTGRSGYAYKGKDSPDGHEAQDNKHIFQVSRPLLRAYDATALRRLPGEARDFLAVGEEAYYSVSRSVKLLYRQLEAEIPGSALVGIHFPTDGLWQHKLRFLAYQRGKGGLLAAGHYDKGTGTVAIGESDGGLRLGFGPDDLAPAEPGPKFFRSYGWHQLLEMMGVYAPGRAAWHDVVDTGQQYSDHISRWALVYFIDPAHMYLDSTTEQTHTPVPWQDLGYTALRSDGKSFLVE